MDFQESSGLRAIFSIMAMYSESYETPTIYCEFYITDACMRATLFFSTSQKHGYSSIRKRAQTESLENGFQQLLGVVIIATKDSFTCQRG